MSEEFRKVALWGRFSSDVVAEPARQIMQHLQGRGISVFVEPTVQEIAGFGECERIPEDGLTGRLDLIVAVGGDGTLLSAARRVASDQIPLLGVNLGRLGFLTDISPDQMLDAIDAVLAGDCLVERRLLLEASVLDADGKETCPPLLALNDVVLQKAETGRMLDFVTEVNGSHVNAHRGDGLIVATATGSTAYALSCAGPIIQPDVDAFVLVPICPHTLSDRPLVVNSASSIVVTVDEDDDVARVTCDGIELSKLGGNDRLHIRAADETVTLLHPTDYNYYELLRSKLHWGTTSRAGRSKSRK